MYWATNTDVYIRVWLSSPNRVLNSMTAGIDAAAPSFPFQVRKMRSRQS